ncbi:MAG: hypothetical protein GY847_29005 [Proteobacteria bacterium]|nr:hypothetical protein [Pseudomonadota bacterium]
MKIANEQDSIRILATLISYADNADRVHLIWTIDSLSQLTRIPDTRVQVAVASLVREKHLYIHKGEYQITDAGRLYYDAVCLQPIINASLHAWKTEVLTGMTQTGNRSKIDNAVLPSPARKQQHRDNPEQLFGQLENEIKAKKKLMNELGVDMAELNKRMSDGSLRYCKGVGYGSHVGIFDRDRNRWQYLCRRCRKWQRTGKK